MEQNNQAFSMLDLISAPAFCAENGVITKCNPAAAQQMIPTHIPVSDILSTGHEEYAAFSGGTLYLSLQAAGKTRNATVHRMDGFDVFMLDSDAEQASLQAMALAAKELREPLSNILIMVDRMFPSLEFPEGSAHADQAAYINRSLYRMLRTISNMSDAVRYSENPAAGAQTRDICAVAEQIFRDASALTEAAGIELRYTGPCQTVYCPVDADLLERAILNLISNAMKFMEKGGIIDARAILRGNKLLVTMHDTGSGIAADVRSAVFSRYQRQPSIEDGRYGIGLGMVLVRAAAAAHGGTVLIEQPENGGTRVTLTLSTQPDPNPKLRSKVILVDYSGERSHGLVELSDCLPAELYRPSKIN